jgi:hypothetical protein
MGWVEEPHIAGALDGIAAALYALGAHDSVAGPA